MFLFLGEIRPEKENFQHEILKSEFNSPPPAYSSSKGGTVLGRHLWGLDSYPADQVR